METTEIEINHSNKAIAEFMEAEYKADDYGDMGYWFKQNPGQEFHLGYHISGLKYHKSWNWLMEVIQKIETFNSITIDIHREATKIKVYAVDGSCIWHYLSWDQESKITHVYNAVVKFITEYYQEIK